MVRKGSEVGGWRLEAGGLRLKVKRVVFASNL
jgi:hypothetical protein